MYLQTYLRALSSVSCASYPQMKARQRITILLHPDLSKTEGCGQREAKLHEMGVVTCGLCVQLDLVLLCNDLSRLNPEVVRPVERSHLPGRCHAASSHTFCTAHAERPGLRGRAKWRRVYFYTHAQSFTFVVLLTCTLPYGSRYKPTVGP